MGLNHSPSVVTDSLLFNLDFKNPKRFYSLGAGNLVSSPNYDTANWIRYFPTNNTITTGIDAPDGSLTAVRMSCKTTGNSLLRVNIPTFTPNGTDVYAISFWVRKVSGTSTTEFWTDLHDGNPSINYFPLLVTGEWVRVVATGTPTATLKSFVDVFSDQTSDFVLDFWGVKLENITAANNEYSFIDQISRPLVNSYRPQYTSFDHNSVTFTRTDSPASKHGGMMTASVSGNLSSSKFLYNDHTWEVWFKINDRYPYGGTNEGVSTLAVYQGYHSGFSYDGTTMYYLLWNGNTGLNYITWTVGASGAQINQGQWCQIVVTRRGNIFTPYINGQMMGTVLSSYTTPIAVNAGISNSLCFGATQNVAAGASQYVFYSKNSISNVKMYNRGLSADEVKQNFNALRGRFGL